MGDEIKEVQGMEYDPIEPGANSPKIDPESKDNAKKSNLHIVLTALVVFSVFSVSAGIALYIAKEAELTKRIVVEANLEDMTTEKMALDEKVAELKALRQQLEDNLLEGKRTYQMLLEQYDSLLIEKQELRDKYSDKMKQVNELKTTIGTAAKENKKINRKLDRALEENDAIKEQLEQIRMAKDALEERIIALNRKHSSRGGVTLGKIVVEEEPVKEVEAAKQTTSPKVVKLPVTSVSMQGQVLVVNKEFAFVVVNIGEKDGIKGSEILDVYRGNQLLGRVQVERIYDTMSSAVILPEFTKDEIKEGDIVRLI